MKQFIINQNDSGQRIDKFLQKAVYKLPKTAMYKFIRTKKIKLNGKRCEISTKLNQGDIITLYINEDFFNDSNNSNQNLDFLKASEKLDIVYEDENILIINKELGTIIHNNKEKISDTLVNRVKKYLYEKKEYLPETENSFSPAICNRLDRNTSGLVIAAKNAHALRDLNEKIRDNEIHKSYICVTIAKPPKNEDTAIAYLYKNEQENKVKINLKPLENYKKIITKYKVLESKNPLSLLEVDLITGRTHQIRAHLAFLGSPLLGDAKYGNKEMNNSFKENFQCLCAYGLKFEFNSECSLSYLNHKYFNISYKNINFINKYF